MHLTLHAVTCAQDYFKTPGACVFVVCTCVFLKPNADRSGPRGVHTSPSPRGAEADSQMFVIQQV